MSSEEFDCGLDVALAVMCGKWKPLILYHLRSAPKRSGDLKRLVDGIARRCWSAAIIRRCRPRATTRMTPFGMTLVEALLPLCAWGMGRA